MSDDPGSCRAVVCAAGDGTYEPPRELPIPSPMPGGAVLRVEAVGMCASDLAQLHGHKHVPGEVSPVVPGHEIVGRLHALDADAAFGVGLAAARRCRPGAALWHVSDVREREPVLPRHGGVRLHVPARRALRALRRLRRVHGDPAGHAARAPPRRRSGRGGSRCSSRSRAASTGWTGSVASAPARPSSSRAPATWA